MSRFLESRGLLTLALVGAFLWSLLQVDWTGRVIHAGGLEAGWRITQSTVHRSLPTVVRPQARPQTHVWVRDTALGRESQG